MGILELESYLTACIPPGDFTTTSEGSSQKYALMYFLSRTTYIDRLHLCGWSTEPEIGPLFLLLPQALSVSLEKQLEFMCLTCAKQRRDLFQQSQHGRKFCASWNRSHHTESSWNQWNKIDIGHIQAALKLIIRFMRKEIIQFRNYQQQTSLLGLLLPQMSQIKDHLKGPDAFQCKATGFALIARECDLN